MSREGVARQPPAGRGAHGPFLTQLVEHDAVLLRMHDDRHVRVVLRRRPDHRRSSDVDRLDGGLRSERVQVACDEVDRRDVLSRQIGEMRRQRAVGEDAGMDARMQGLHTAAEHRRHAGDGGDLGVSIPASSRTRAVPPLATSSTPRPTSPAAKAWMPVLSYTERSARTIGDATGTSGPRRRGSSRPSRSWSRPSTARR